MLADDGLHTPEVGEWAERKYRLLATYAQMFATSMKGKWAARIYMDLFAGAGRARIKGTGRIVTTSAFRALDVREPFDLCIFCDIEPECIEALRMRIARDHPDRDVRYFVGDTNELVDSILQVVPKAGRRAGVLAFCVLDPFNLSNLKFATVQRLSSIFVDFLILIPSHMDANREQRTYASPGSTALEEFLGNPHWRDDWEAARGEFGTFVVDQFGKSMRRLGFIYENPGEEVLIRLPGRNVKLYYLAFYSKSPLGMKFWREARKYSDEQLDLFG